MKRINVIVATLVVLAVCAPLLAQQPAKPSEPEYDQAQWTVNSRIVKEEIDREVPDAKKLSMALARLAVAALGEHRVNEAIALFFTVDGQNKLPAEAGPYYAKLLVDKQSYQLQKREEHNGTASFDDALPRALQLSVRAYAAESEAKSIDARKLTDIARLIAGIYSAMGKKEDRMASMRAMLSSSSLPDSVRAAISYELAVSLWREAYDSTARFTSKNQPIPDTLFPAIRDLVNEGLSVIEVAQTLEPTFANSWFYEKLLILENMKIEPARLTPLAQRAREAQDKFLFLHKHLTVPDGFVENDRRPYFSGMPSLAFSPPPPPPPPAYPLSRRQHK